ncbi:hypothetical protein ACOYW6_12785 [Parablastomonas sp. CN1-191]|uniref:hypothetical protein n=1 Tax=Parablastomonas sp. CN1-191 TaxID=3400908 RepID=UPI003BF8F3F4
MTDPSDILFELLGRYAKNECNISEADISRWTEGSVDAEEGVFDGIAALLARGYHERRYSFEFCDEVVNELYEPMISRQFLASSPPWPELYWSVFEAFDAGEFHRQPDKSDDPIAEFTVPAIADIVRGL